MTHDTTNELRQALTKVLETMATDCENVHQARLRGHSVVTTPMSDHLNTLESSLAAQKQRWEAEARIDENSVLWKTAIVPHLTRADDSIYIPIRDAMDARIAALDGELGKEQADV